MNKEYDNLSYVLDKTNIWYGAMSTLQQKKNLMNNWYTSANARLQK